MNIRHLQASVL